jgi:uncharacterized membrane protein
MSHVRNYDTRFELLVATLVGSIALLADFFLRFTFWGGVTGGRRGRSSSDSGGGALVLIMFVVGIVLAIVAPIIAGLVQLAVSRQREENRRQSSRRDTERISATRECDRTDRCVGRGEHRSRELTWSTHLAAYEHLQERERRIVIRYRSSGRLRGRMRDGGAPRGTRHLDGAVAEHASFRPPVVAVDSAKEKRVHAAAGAEPCGELITFSVGLRTSLCTTRSDTVNRSMRSVSPCRSSTKSPRTSVAIGPCAARSPGIAIVAKAFMNLAIGVTGEPFMARAKSGSAH